MNAKPYKCPMPNLEMSKDNRVIISEGARTVHFVEVTTHTRSRKESTPSTAAAFRTSLDTECLSTAAGRLGAKLDQRVYMRLRELRLLTLSGHEM